jgi:hypothetical protein
MKFLKWIAIILVLALCGYIAWQYSARTLVSTNVAPQSAILVHGDANTYKGTAAKNAIAEMNKWLAENKNGWKIGCDDPSSEVEFYNPEVLSVKVGSNFVTLKSDDRVYCQAQKNDNLLASLKVRLAEGQKLAAKEDEEIKANEKLEEQKRLANLPSCNFERKEKIAFESKGKKNDDLLVRIVGKPCYNAIYSIEIKNTSGKSLYSYKAEFKPHVAIQWDDSALDGDASRLVSETGGSEWPTTGVLPKDLSEATGVEQEIKVPPAKYSELHKMNLPLFRHLTGYESWRYVVFDPAQGKAVVLVEGGE